MCVSACSCPTVEVGLKTKGTNVAMLSVCPEFTPLNRCFPAVEQRRVKEWSRRRSEKERENENECQGQRVIRPFFCQARETVEP